MEQSEVHEFPCGCQVRFPSVEFRADGARVEVELTYCADHNDLAVLVCGNDLFFRVLTVEGELCQL